MLRLKNNIVKHLTDLSHHFSLSDFKVYIIRLSILKVLKEEGYIDNFVFVDKELKKEDIRIFLRYDNDSMKLEAGMKEIFTKARFEPRSGKRLVRKKWRTFRDEIVESLESGGAIPEEVRWDIEDILMDKNISYVVFAYFDVGVPEMNPNTALQNVNVALVIAEIIRLGDSDPVSLGTISGVQAKGQGSDSEIAKNNGINKTAQKTAKKLVALINSKGIN